MKKHLLIAALLTIAMSGRAEVKQALTLNMQSGAQIVYYLDSQPEIGFEGQSMVVSATGESKEIPMQDVDCWVIGMVDDAGIAAATDSGKVKISVIGNTLTVASPTAAPVSVYNTAGQMVGSSAEAVATFTLPKGIYIINVANESFKIAVR